MTNRARTPRARIAAALAAVLLACFGLAATAAAQPLTGTYNIPGDYATLTAAVTDLNARGVGVGGAVLNLVAGNPQTAPAGGYVVGGSGSLVLTSTGSDSPVTIQGNGNTITAYAPQAAGTLTDALFKLVGADWITVTGFTLQENPANATITPASNNLTEWGLALLRVSATDGAQNNTIQNNTISLNRAYANSFGVYSNVRHSSTTIATTADATAATGANSGNRIYGNSISNVNLPVCFVGSNTVANMDQGNDIGGDSDGTGNTIFNWGGAPPASGYVSVSGTIWGVYANNQIGVNISNNTLTSAPLASSTTTRGIFLDYTGSSPTGTFTDNVIGNTVTVTNSTASTFEMIRSQGISTANAAATINLNNNRILNCATPGSFVGVANSSIPGAVSLSGNVLVGIALYGTASAFAGVQNSGAVTNTINIDNNQIGNAGGGAVTFNVASGGTLYAISNTGGAGTAVLTITGNDVSGITHAVAGSSGHSYIFNSAATLSQNLSSNTFTNLNVDTTGTVYFIYDSVTIGAAGSKTINGNSIVGTYTKSGAGGTVYAYYDFGSSAAGSVANNDNNFSNITLAGATTMGGWYNQDGGTPSKTLHGNTFTNWTCGSGTITAMNVNDAAAADVTQNTVGNIIGGGGITGIALGSSLSSVTATGNSVSGLASTGIATVQGLNTAATTAVIAGNRIYDLSVSSAAPTGVYGLVASAGTTVTLVNNLIGDLRAPAANSTTDVVRGISLTSTTSSSNLNLYYNTVYLNATSAGANFGTTGIYHAANPTATTAALNLVDNIVVNLSTPRGAGITAAYRRSSSFLGNYGTGSNHNLFYAGTPGATRLVFTDGTNADPTLTAFKARVWPREAVSVTENPSFLSTSGASPAFLHLDPATPTQVESAGQAIAGYAEDVDGVARNATTPDIGADEGDFPFTDLTGPTITYAPLGNEGGLVTRYAGNIAITDPSFVDGSPATRPRLYYKRSGDANAFDDNTNGTGGWKWVAANGEMSPFDFTLDYGKLGGPVAVGTVIQYFVVAQDLAASPNVAVNSGTLAAPSASVNLLPAAFPVGGAIRSYTIVDLPLNGDYVISAMLFSEVSGLDLAFSPKVDRVLRAVLEPEDQQPQMSGDKTSDEVFLADRLGWKSAEREVEQLGWEPQSGGRNYNGPLYVKRSENPGLPAQALAGVYATITAAVADLNTRGVGGPVRFLLADSNYPAETFPITVKVTSSHLPTATKSVTIQPAPGVVAAVTGAAPGSALFKILGTDHVAIDGSNAVGGSSRDLILENTSATSPNVVWLASIGTVPLAGAALRNCVVRGGATSGSAVVISDGLTPGGAGYFSDLEVSNNRIEKASVGVYANGGTTPAHGVNLTINGNQLDTGGANAIRLTGLYVQGVNGATVTGNVIGNLENITGENDTGIWLASGTTNALVSGNTVTNLGFAGAAAFAPIGINVTTGVAGANIDVAQNTVTNIGTSGSTAVRGIASSGPGTADVVIQRNVVSGVANTNPGTFGAYGIDVAGGNNHVVKNNFVSDVKFNMTSGVAFSTTFGVFGIRVASGTGHLIAANSVNLYGALPGLANSALLTAALGVVGMPFTGCDIRDNLLANTITGGTTSVAHVAAFLRSGGTPSMNLTWNNNAYFSGTNAATQGIAQVGTTAGTGFYRPGDFNPAAATPAANLRAYTSTLSTGGTNDSASLASTAAAPFLADTNLHVRTDALSAVSNAGVAVAGLTDDIDGDPRDPTPDIGADEFAIYTLNVATVGSGTVTVDPVRTIYPAGTTVTLTAVPADACQQFVGWSGGATGSANPLTVVMNSSLNITATFAPKTYTITATAAAGGAISPGGAVAVNCGADQVFTITADVGRNIADVLVDGVSVGAVGSYTFAGVNASHTIEASFSTVVFTIAASAGTGGTIDPAGSTAVAFGTDRTFTMTPDDCHDLLDVLVDGVSVGAALSYTFTFVTANHTIEALFAQKSFTISASAGAGGAISPTGAVAVTCGGDQAFAITADVGQSIADVLVDGVSVGPVGSYTFTGVNANHTIEASFSTSMYNIVASAGPGGMIDPVGSVAVASGADRTFTITPDACYDVLDVLVDGVSVGAVLSYTFTAVDANHTVEALFAQKSFNVTAAAGAGGAISPAGAVAVICGADQAFTITPDACYDIADVLVDGLSVGAVSSYTFTGVAAGHTIDASFALRTYTIAASAGLGGTISPDGAVAVSCGADQTFVITANVGQSIADVLVDGVSVGAVGSYAFTGVNANHTIEASFSTVYFNIVASAGLGGTIAPAGTVPVAFGADQTLAITPDGCYDVLDVLVDGVSVGAVTSYTFTGVATGHTIDASFVAKAYTITASAGAGGSISPSGVVAVACGADQAFAITADAGQNILDVLVDGVSVGAVGSYTFTGVNANHTIEVSFSTSMFNIAASAGTGGTIDPVGSTAVAFGADQTFTITPDGCHDVMDVLVDGVSVGAVLSHTFTAVSASHTIEALFAQKSFTITASAGAGGAISPSGAVAVICGADQSFTITPDACYDIADVLVDGLTVGAVSSYTFTGVAAGHTIDASFAQRTYTIAASAGLGGTISPDGAVAVSCGADQTFVITANVGQSIADVLVDGVSVGAVASYTFTGVSANHTIEASFSTVYFDIVASAGLGGTIAPAGTVPVAYGTDRSFAITPDGCYDVLDVLVDGVSVGAVTSYTFTAVDASHTVAAAFALKSFTITAAAGAGGTVSPSGAVAVGCGADQTFTITADVGQNIADVLVDGVSVGAVASYAFTAVAANHTIEASFVDTLGPEVTVLAPSGGEMLIFDVAVSLTWTASDNTGVTCVDLLLSRSGLAGPFEMIATCVPNSGHFNWMIGGQATDHALLKVVARDAAGNARESVSEAEFRIVQRPVATLLTRFEAIPTLSGVEVRWALSGLLPFVRTEVERSEAEFGPFVKLEQSVDQIDGDNVLVDDTAETGRTYWYRLSGVTRGGQTINFEPVSTKAGVPVVDFALRITGANPTHDLSRIAFAVPRPSHVRVTVVDLQGRRVATLADGVFNAGRYEAAWDGRGEKGRMASGMYMIRLEAPGANLIQRVTFVH